ncbi:MAG: twin-arginine translocase subunit TatC, partial [Pirellulaceae bacterium]
GSEADEDGGSEADEDGGSEADEDGGDDTVEETDSVSPVAHLGSLLNEVDQVNASKLAEATPQQLQEDEELRQATVNILNGWVARERLSHSPAFKKFIDDDPQLVKIRDDINKPSSNSNARLNDRRLNRLVICKVFQDCLRPAQPQLLNVPLWRPIDIRVQTLNAHEAFMIWLKAAFICGFLIASPWVFYQVWSFIAAGLYSHEKKYVGVYVPLSLALFLGGAALAFFFVFEPVLDFLFGFNRAMNIHPDPRISEWMGFVLFLPIGFGVAFQLPLVMLMLHRIGLVSVEVFLAKWRVAVLVICIVSMLLTPADPISMLLMAVPLVVLYFFGIGLAIWMPRIKNPYSEGYDPS